ncbi:uncharacterized protein LOC133320361 [Danaus plexippus]|uniref:uncharacterized protein LOC133320361 n=1 Tax=Danaus plexippus TaxID=13037 RepID=UPI002AB0097C|nr:uncharacterized protein LOC133320361 [Danaus plexippus]
MISNILSSKTPHLRYDKCELNNIYQKFQSVLNKSIESCGSRENMLSSRASTVASDESFITPVSSMGDLMAMSPRKPRELDQPDVTSDLLTGSDFDSICDVTMQEVPLYDDNLFIDANSLDYLVKCAESNRNHTMIDRGKESLFVKFDPLYAKQLLNNSEPSHEVSHLESIDGDIGYETGSSTSAMADNNVASPKHTLSAGSIVSKCTKDKPTQVVPPVVSNELSKASVAQTRTTPVLLRSVSAILAPTQATERLINFSDNTPIAAPRSPRQCRQSTYASQEVDRLHSLRIILQNQDQEVLQLRQENRELKSSLQDLQHNCTRTNEELEKKVKKLTDERDSLLEREIKLIKQVNDKTLSHKQMCIVMEEYEKTISSLIGEQQKEKLFSQELYDKLTLERDEALKHLSSMESSFNDLLAKYEKCKSVIMESRDKEKILNNKINEYESGMQKYEALYNNLKQVTSDNLEKANEELENVKKSHSVDITKLNAIIKKHEIMISSLQESLAQKTRDNEELTRICDQLINEVR